MRCYGKQGRGAVPLLSAPPKKGLKGEEPFDLRGTGRATGRDGGVGFAGDGVCRAGCVGR